MVDYKLAYKRFIDKTRAENKKDGYKLRADFDRASSKNLEIHHVKPRALGGTNALNNLVVLSHDEHIFAHFLLNLSLYQQKNWRGLQKIDYHVDLPAKFWRRNAFRNLKVKMWLSGKKAPCSTFTMRQAAQYVACIRRMNPFKEETVQKCMWKVFLLAKSNRNFGGVKLMFDC